MQRTLWVMIMNKREMTTAEMVLKLSSGVWSASLCSTFPFLALICKETEGANFLVSVLASIVKCYEKHHFTKPVILSYVIADTVPGLYTSVHCISLQADPWGRCMCHESVCQLIWPFPRLPAKVVEETVTQVCHLKAAFWARCWRNKECMCGINDAAGAKLHDLQKDFQCHQRNMV